MIDEDFSKEFSDDTFWGKLKSYAKTAGSEVVERALQLYYAAQDPGTPKWAKSVIAASLGYFIIPLDAVPDIAPVLGYSDDLGVLAVALVAVAMFISGDVKAKAQAKMKDWFE